MDRWLFAGYVLLSIIVDSAIVPRGYRLDLHPYPGDGVFKGKVRIDIINNDSQPISSLTLDVHSSLNLVDREVRVTRLSSLDSSEEVSTENR